MSNRYFRDGAAFHLFETMERDGTHDLVVDRIDPMQHVRIPLGLWKEIVEDHTAHFARMEAEGYVLVDDRWVKGEETTCPST